MCCDWLVRITKKISKFCGPNFSLAGFFFSQARIFRSTSILRPPDFGCPSLTFPSIHQQSLFTSTYIYPFYSSYLSSFFRHFFPYSSDNTFLFSSLSFPFLSPVVFSRSSLSLIAFPLHILHRPARPIPQAVFLQKVCLSFHLYSFNSHLIISSRFIDHPRCSSHSAIRFLFVSI